MPSVPSPWIAWFLAATFFFLAFLLRVSPSVMVTELMRDFAVGGAILGNLSAFYFYAYAGLQIPVGILMDRIGPRRLLSAAAALAALGCVVFATAHSVGPAYLGRLLIGAGCAFGFVGVLTIAAQWFAAGRFALLGGITQFFGMAGAITGQAPLGAAVAVVGWRPVLLAAGMVCGLLAAGLWLAVRDRPHPAARGPGLWSGLRVVAANPQTWLIAAVGMTLTGPMLAFAGLWAVPFLRAAYGLERPAAAGIISLLFVGWGLAAPLLGLLSDRLGRRRPLLMAGGALCALGLAGIVYVPDLPLPVLALLFVVVGVGGSNMNLTYMSVREHNPPEAGGVAMGLVNMAVVGSGALFQPLIGWFLDLQWDGALVDGARVYGVDAYGLALLVLPAGSLLGVGLAWAIREAHGPRGPG